MRLTFVMVMMLCIPWAHADKPALVVVALPLPTETKLDDRTKEALKVPWRIKITNLADGIFAGWPGPHSLCGSDVQEHVSRVVMKHPYIEIIDGKMAARVDEKRPVAAHHQVFGDVFVAFYDVTDTRTIVFTVHWQAAGNIKDTSAMVPVDVSVIAWKQPGDRDDPNQRITGCRETWIGIGKRI